MLSLRRAINLSPRPPNDVCQSCHEFAPYFMVHNHIWMAVREPGEQFLCPQCIGVRLGRPLWFLDFPACHVNTLAIFTPEHLIEDVCTAYDWPHNKNLKRTRVYFAEFFSRLLLL